VGYPSHGRLSSPAPTAGGPPVGGRVVWTPLGEYLVFDDVLARIVGVAPGDGSWDDEVRSAFGGYATDQLENIAWAATSSAQQSPQTAIVAVRALRDLLTRWLEAHWPPSSSRVLTRGFSISVAS